MLKHKLNYPNGRKIMRRNPFLRVKLKSLAAESTIIRKEERKALKFKDYDLCTSLHNHRLTVVRREARATLLAYQYLRGKSFASCEVLDIRRDASGKVIFWHIGKRGKCTINWESVTSMVRRYGLCVDFDYTRWVEGEVLQIAKAA